MRTLFENNMDIRQPDLFKHQGTSIMDGDLPTFTPIVNWFSGDRIEEYASAHKKFHVEFQDGTQTYIAVDSPKDVYQMRKILIYLSGGGYTIFHGEFPLSEFTQDLDDFKAAMIRRIGEYRSTDIPEDLMEAIVSYVMSEIKRINDLVNKLPNRERFSL